MTLTPNQDRNSEMNRTIEATPAIRSARDQRAASNLKAGTDDPVDAEPAGAAASGGGVLAAGGGGAAAAGGGVLTAGAAVVVAALAPNEAPQLGQNVASSAASL